MGKDGRESSGDDEVASSLQEAEASDAERITTSVDATYNHHSVSVAEADGSVIAVIVLSVTDEGFLVDNVAVHPSHAGRGLGRALLAFAEAEAKRASSDSIYLFTHEKMTESLAFSSKLGYVEYDCRSLGDFRSSICANALHESSGQKSGRREGSYASATR